LKVENSLHANFKLQGKSFDNHYELIDFSSRISRTINSFLNDWFNAKGFVEVKSSGSTGTPKVVRLQKRHMINSAIATGEYFHLNNNIKALLCMSPDYIAGKMMLIRALTLGWHLDVVDPKTNPLRDCEGYYDFAAMVPLQLHHSLDDIYKVKKIIVGGGPVSKELSYKIQNVETEIFATYGMTETITHIAVKKLNHFRHNESVTTAHYEILPNISISLDDRKCLIIAAPTIADDKVITNDLVELMSVKTFKWLGRYDAVINSGGIKLIPEQIEEKLSALISNRFFVAGLPDSVLGEKLILVIENKTKNISKENLLKKIKDLKHISKFEIPKEIYLLQRFFETPTKKINRTKTLQLINT
jgi:O-succinylbenzoic acid--CoA ligase